LALLTSSELGSGLLVGVSWGVGASFLSGDGCLGVGLGPLFGLSESGFGFWSGFSPGFGVLGPFGLGFFGGLLGCSLAFSWNLIVSLLL